MTKVRIPLIQIDGLECKNATVDIENGYVVAEYGEKVQEPEFKRGDYVIGYIGDIKYACIYDVCYVLMSPLESENVMYAPFGFTHVIKTNKQSMQILFDALAKEGKYWDAETLEVKDIPKEEIIKNIFRELRGHNISVNEAYRRMHKLIPING